MTAKRFAVCFIVALAGASMVADLAGVVHGGIKAGCILLVAGVLLSWIVPLMRKAVH